MADNELLTKCKQLLAHRDAPRTPWFYVTHDWRRQLLFLLVYVAVAAGLWAVDFRLASVALMGFVVGRTIRDFRWWKALSKEWLTTKSLLDWRRIESIANGTNDGDSPIA